MTIPFPPSPPHAWRGALDTVAAGGLLGLAGCAATGTRAAYSR